jgi:hypothetical protein
MFRRELTMSARIHPAWLAAIALGCAGPYGQQLTEVETSPSVQDTAVQIVVPPVVDTADTDPPEPIQPLALTGQYADQWGTQYEFTTTGWTATLGASSNEQELTAWSNEDEWMVGENASTNALHPNRWSRVQWSWQADLLYLCQLTNSAKTEEAALQLVLADATSPTTQGCNGGPWLTLTSP